ncbi:hypothetical protein QAD02_023440 [Eretmocerus hayati]|uniref:Uncharacterized protein n=1 Tax=Eretmocerus hayati TaxID=131215 RepID=A0ACC2PXI0_9HYME|nr:hypothetical protein QAD02_023440 [Eretmocerus hayati]
MASSLELMSSREHQCIVMKGSLKLMIELREKLQEWLTKQPHLPHDMEESRLEYFIVSSKHSLELAKQRIDMYYTTKKLVPEILTNRDPFAKQLKKISQFMQFVCVPELTPEKLRVVITRYTSTDVGSYKLSDLLKYILMIIDVGMSTDRSLGNIYICDLSKMRLGHLTQLTPSLLKTTEIISTKVYGVSIKGIHIINAPSFVDRIVTLAKTTLKPKMAARVSVHPSGLESLYKVVPKSYLPVDYGGDQPSIDELDEKQHNKLEECRDWFMKEDLKTIKEDLRPGPAVNHDDLFGLYGSFRKLQVD